MSRIHTFLPTALATHAFSGSFSGVPIVGMDTGANAFSFLPSLPFLVLVVILGKRWVSAAGPSATTALNVASVCFGLRDSNFRDHYFRMTLPLALFLHPSLKQMNSGFDFDHALGMTYQNVSFLFVCKTVFTLLIFFFGMGLRPWISILSRMGLYPRWDRLMSLLVRGADLASRGHTGWSLATSP